MEEFSQESSFLHAKGGREFYVYQIDDTDFNYTVTSIHGPYKCK